MKKLKIFFIFIFFLLLSTPLIFFNWKENVISEIDNRTLTNNPFGSNSDRNIGKFTAIKNYIDDRIGFRDHIINLYTLTNDKLFNEMIHPTYEYGTNGYIFFKIKRPEKYSEYHQNYAQMVQKIQNYCDERNTPFVFVLNPSKSLVLKEYLPKGVNYDIFWKEQFISDLKEMNINYVDTSDILIEKAKQGEIVFNKKYNAGHWNDLGAFYGVNEILKNLKTQAVNVSLNNMNDFTINNKLNTSLPVSKFSIKETEPIFSHNKELEYKNYESEELELNKQFHYFYHPINNDYTLQNTPKTLVFQGSYMNGMGYKFLENSLKEYIGIHDYQNVLNFDYYFNIFKPECVIFEVADYTFSDGYFNFNKMKEFNLNPELSTLSSFKLINDTLNYNDISYDIKSTFTTVNLNNINNKVDYLYLSINDEIFDMRKSNDNSTWEATITNDKLDKNKIKIISIDLENKTKTEYLVN